MRHSKSRAASRLTKQLNESTTTAIYTLSLHDALPISVIIQATVIGFIPVINFGLNNESHALLAAILGGLLIGVGVGGALKYGRSEEHTSELQSRPHLVCRLLLETKNTVAINEALEIARRVSTY